MNPRAELRDRLERIAAATVPHLKVPGRIQYLARRISEESGLSVGAGTVKDWLYALDDDARRVDSRHMDWARARSRQICANDNGRTGNIPGRISNPCSAEAVTWGRAA